MERQQAILDFWFGHVEETIVPSKRRARIWFGDDLEIDHQIKEQFNDDMQHAIAGEYDHWQQEPRGQLALIIMFDQFSRHLFRNSQQAYAQDQRALDICLAGMRHDDEHRLSLIERVFFYFPLLHVEDLKLQEQSVAIYQELANLALDETKVIYESFYKFAVHHYEIIRRFGRFPQRNDVLSRVSTESELQYLAEHHESE